MKASGRLTNRCVCQLIRESGGVQWFWLEISPEIYQCCTVLLGAALERSTYTI